MAFRQSDPAREAEDEARREALARAAREADGPEVLEGRAHAQTGHAAPEVRYDMDGCATLWLRLQVAQDGNQAQGQDVVLAFKPWQRASQEALVETPGLFEGKSPTLRLRGRTRQGVFHAVEASVVP